MGSLELDVLPGCARPLLRFSNLSNINAGWRPARASGSASPDKRCIVSIAVSLKEGGMEKGDIFYHLYSVELQFLAIP